MSYNLTNDHFKQIIESLTELQPLRHELEILIKNNPTFIDDILTDDFVWSELYDLKFIEQLAITILVMGLGEDFKKIKDMQDPVTYMFNHLKDDVSDEWVKPDIEGVDIEKEHFIATLFALFKTIDSIKIYGKSLNTLVKEVKDGHDDSLFQAVKLDHSIVSNPSIARRITRAELANDEMFFKRLSAAVLSRPRKQTKAYDNLRYVLAILDEHGMLETLSDEDAYDLLCVELELYPANSDDAAGSLNKFITRFKRTHRTSNKKLVSVTE